MGNTIETNNETQEPTVIANQTINPETLKTIDDFKKSPGKMIMHEVSEAYYGASISLSEGVNARAAKDDVIDNPESIYNRAHNMAFPQHTVHINTVDVVEKGRFGIKKSKREEYYVTRWFFKKKVFQTNP